MSHIRSFAQAACLGLAVSLTAGGAVAQEISQSHLQAGIAVSRSAPSVGDFDALLPYLSEQVQNRIIRTRPDLFAQIADAVEAEALAMSARRNDLDNDIARIWAKQFTEEELNQIAAFFGSETGAKYKSILPQVGEEVLRSSRGWASRISDELYERSVEALKKQGHEL